MKILKAWMLMVSLVSAVTANAQSSDMGRVSGTVVSIRGNILQMRPWLRPKMTRISFGDNTEILARRQVTKEFLQPGMRVYMRGFYNEKFGMRPFFVESAKEPIGNLKGTTGGVKVDPGGFGEALGTIKTVNPFVFTDENGKEYTASIENARRFFEVYRGNKNGVLIGTRLEAVGPIAPDGVLQAQTITPDRNYAAVGMMFGQILAVKGHTLTIRPRYTQDSMEVTIKEGCTLQRELEVDPDTIKLGDKVTFWAQRGRGPNQQKDFQAIALLLGAGRYPAESGGDTAAPFLTGKLVAFDPVQIALPNGQRPNITIPAQMAVARLVKIKLSDLKPGTQALLVLERIGDNGFASTHIIMDASPWVGYGQ